MLKCPSRSGQCRNVVRHVRYTGFTSNHGFTAFVNPTIFEDVPTFYLSNPDIGSVVGNPTNGAIIEGLDFSPELGMEFICLQDLSPQDEINPITSDMGQEVKYLTSRINSVTIKLSVSSWTGSGTLNYCLVYPKFKKREANEDWPPGHVTGIDSSPGGTICRCVEAVGESSISLTLTHERGDLNEMFRIHQRDWSLGYDPDESYMVYPFYGPQESVSISGFSLLYFPFVAKIQFLRPTGVFVDMYKAQVVLDYVINYDLGQKLFWTVPLSRNHFIYSQCYWNTEALALYADNPYIANPLNMPYDQLKYRIRQWLRRVARSHPRVQVALLGAPFKTWRVHWISYLLSGDTQNPLA